MAPFRPISGRAQVQVLVVFLLFFSVALAALQNVTLDDAVLTGVYLPNDSAWHIGNNCSVCAVKPDPTLAYNHTWHDATFFPGNGLSQAIQFSFTGNALYVFFILANSLPDITTTTQVNFVLDGVAAGMYNHTPAPTSDYEYNVPIYANNSLDYGAHTLLIEPANTGIQILMLFDYLIYTTDTSASPSETTAGLPSSSVSQPCPSSSALSDPQTTVSSSRRNVNAIVGGTVGGVAAIALMIMSVLCYRSCKRRHSLSSPEEGAIAPFILSREVGPGQTPGPSSFTPSFTPSSAPVPHVVPSTPRSSDRDIPHLLAQVEQLRTEVSRLSYLRRSDPTAAARPRLHSESPPEYS